MPCAPTNPVPIFRNRPTFFHVYLITINVAFTGAVMTMFLRNKYLKMASYSRWLVVVSVVIAAGLLSSAVLLPSSMLQNQNTEGYAACIDEDNDGIDEYGMSSLERKQMKQAVAESRYTGYVEDELRRNLVESTMEDRQKGQLQGQNVEFHKAMGVNQVLKCLPLALTRTYSGPYMQAMIDTITGVGPGVKGPSGEDDDYYNPIDLNHIFHDNDILEEWTRETEEPMLPENDLDWLDEEWRMDNVPNDEDDDASLPLSRCAQVSSSRKDKRVLHSSSRQNDSDEETAEDDDNDDDDDDDDDGDDDGDNDGDGNVHKETQQSHGMTWVQGDEKYYATQDSDHGRQPDIQYSMQNLEIDEHRPHQMHGHQGSSTGTNNGRSKTRRRNRGSATYSIGESNQRSSIEISHSSGTGTYSQGFGYYNQNMEHLMPSQPLPQVPYNIPYQGVFPQVPYGLPSQPVMYFPYGIPSHLAGVINVGSYTTPYTQNCSLLHMITIGGLM
ncbi:hypothetical protein Sango_1200300 [Sesamum angolense]|uniref:Uncharacterized protein n=1 Tax=Sesamum angolense TaxID=2727404 RepID=A0AAE1WWI7_9LAMI|nr:hypothetical protein Sango_1200300 [Sesamum angolense]